VLPGSEGVRVVNGSAYGVGIYTATRPQTGYARHFDHLGKETFQMFCCAGLLTPSVKRTGVFAVFFDAALVLPCFLVTLYRASSAEPQALPSYVERVVSELPVKVPCLNENLIAYPQAGIIVESGDRAPSSWPRGLQCMMPQGSLTLRSRRVVCLARGDHLSGVQGPTWYDRRRCSLTKFELRRLPRSAKELYPLLRERRQDQKRTLERRWQHLERHRARAQKASSYWPGDD
jgi:hypothetical protein